MDLEEVGCPAKYLIRDWDSQFPALFDSVLKDAGIEVVLSGIRMPRMNAIMERWVQTCRRELLDRTLIWNQRHLLHALREYERFYNGHRPHQGIANARPLHPLPAPITNPYKITRLDIRRRDHLDGVLHEYEQLRDLRGRGFRQLQPYTSTNATTTSTALTAASRTPAPYTRCPNRSPIPRR